MKKKQRPAPPFDVRKVIRAAMEAALEEPPQPVVPTKKKKKGLSGGRAVLLGAGLFTAGRVLVSGRGGGLVDSVKERVSDLGVELPGKGPDDEDLDEEELLDEPEDAADDLVEDEEPEEEEPEEEEAEEEELEDEGPANGGAPERQPRRQRRGR
jgi:hypothetical protein